MEEKLSIANLTKIKTGELAPPYVGQAFVMLKNNILGEAYSLSIAYVTPAKSRELNKKYRGKDNPTNVLSFALNKNEGEIILCPLVIKKEAKDKKFGQKFSKNFPELLVFLVIHGMLHLKGMLHSSRMDKAEEKYWKIYDQKYNNRNRRGIQNDQSRRGRVPKGRKKS